jgi:hypothetical protein
MRASGEPATLKGESASSSGAVEGNETVADTVTQTGALASRKRVPDFFIVGHEKCGTTALYSMLRQHPQIYMPDLKEPRFFAPELRSRLRQSAGVRRVETLDDYLALFAAASPEQRAGEASPQYLRSRAAAGRIADVQPAARIIAILREPTSFLRTFHLQCVQGGIETERDLRKAIALEEPRRQGSHIPRGCVAADRLLYSDHVRYVEQLRSYHAVFSPERVLILIYEDFRRDNEATIRTVLRFLEVDETYPIDGIETKGRQRRAVRLMPLHSLTRAIRTAQRNPALAGPVSRTVNALIPRQLQGEAAKGIWSGVVYTPARPPEEGLTLELRRRFKPEVEALSDYLGRDLVTLWGYDNIG